MCSKEQKIRENFYFTNMFSFVSIWCNSCSICQKTKGNNSPIKPPIGIIDANYPIEDEETVANALIEIFCIVGFPVRLHSDRGTQFTQLITHRVMEQLKDYTNFSNMQFLHLLIQIIVIGTRY